MSFIFWIFSICDFEFVEKSNSCIIEKQILNICFNFSASAVRHPRL